MLLSSQQGQTQGSTTCVRASFSQALVTFPSPKQCIKHLLASHKAVVLQLHTMQFFRKVLNLSCMITQCFISSHRLWGKEGKHFKWLLVCMLCCLMLTCPGILEMPSKEHQIFFPLLLNVHSYKIRKS